MVLDVKNLKKVYRTRGVETTALRNVNFSVNAGEYVSIMGESGSGKSTLLNIIATYDQATEGQVILNGKDLSTIKKNDMAAFRRKDLGFIFQDFNLLDIFNNKDNILLPLVLSNVSVAEMENRLKEIVGFLEIEDLMEKYPYELSGGQQQRVAIARALISNPQLVLADEPTGSLDSKTSNQILNLFKKINAASKTILMVTHSIRAAATSNRVLFIKDGIIFHELYRGDDSDIEFQERIADSLSMLNERRV